MSAHIKNVHGINISEDFSLEESDSTLKKQKTLTGFILRKSIEEEISRPASVDGLSFQCIAKSTFIQENLRKTKYDRRHPTSHEGVKHMVLSFYNNKKNEIADYFESAVKSGRRFSLSLDEYTSSKCSRYMNINVHDVNEHWSLGMIRVSHSLDYSMIIEMVSKRLEEFGLDPKVQIVGCTTDGASVMVKFGKEITSYSYHQQCIAHCIHLAVSDILYCKVNKSSHDEGHNDVTVEDEIFEEDNEIEENQDMTDPLFENVSEKMKHLKLLNNTQKLLQKSGEFAGCFEILLSRMIDCRTLLKKISMKN